jgi:hypothetical protein
MLLQVAEQEVGIHGLSLSLSPLSLSFWQYWGLNQGFPLARQVLYRLSLASSPEVNFCTRYNVRMMIAI